MVQWTDLKRIKKFVNQMRLYVTCEKSGGLHLVEPGLTADWLSGWQAGWLDNDIWGRLEILKAFCRLKYLIFRFV